MKKLLVMFTILGLLLPVSLVSAEEAVYEYSFEESLNDASSTKEGRVVGEKVGVEGGNVSYADGKEGKALVLDGSTGVLLPDGLITSNSYSISLWLNPEELTDYTPAFFGFGKDASWISIAPQAVNGQTMVWSGEEWYDGLTGGTIAVSTWSHIVLTVDNGAVKVYIDGVVKHEGEGFPNVFEGNTGQFALGVNFWDVAYKGMIDELKIYPTQAIDAAAVAALAGGALEETPVTPEISPEETPVTPEITPEKKDDNSVLYIAGGVVVLVVAVGALALNKKKKNKA